jgi:hypothetical protein
MAAATTTTLNVVSDPFRVARLIEREAPDRAAFSAVDGFKRADAKRRWDEGTRRVSPHRDGGCHGP